MIELYAITVHYIFSRCFKKIQVETDLLKVDAWVRKLYIAITQLMVQLPEGKPWLNSLEDTRLKYLRQKYEKAQVFLESGRVHENIKLEYSTFKPILLFSEIGDSFYQLNLLFDPSQIPPKFHLIRRQGITKSINYSLTDTDIAKLPNPNLSADATVPSILPQPTYTTRKPLLRFHVPIKPEFFLGRKKLLLDINERLTTAQHRTHILLLNGIGGMGKTTVMQEYLNQPECQNHFDRIIFTAVDKNLTSAFINAAAQALDLEAQKEEFFKKEEQLSLITGLMSKIDGNNLFVLDNINEYDFDDLLAIRPFLLESGWKFLITTRTVPDVFSALDVEELSDEDAALLFAYHYLPRNISSLNYDEIPVQLLKNIKESGLAKDISKLLTHIAKHTLLTELLAKAGLKKGLSPIELLASLKDQDLKHPKLQRLIYIGQYGKRLSTSSLHNYLLEMFETSYLVEKTGNPSVDEENDKKAMMLRLFSLLPAEDIPVNDLCTLWEVNDDTINEFEDRLDLLRQIGWLQGKKEPEDISYLKMLVQKATYKMHPLIQHVVYETLKPDDTNCKPLIKSITKLLENQPTLLHIYRHYFKSISDKLHELKQLLNPNNLPNIN